MVPYAHVHMRMGMASLSGHTLKAVLVTAGRCVEGYVLVGIATTNLCLESVEIPSSLFQ